MREFKNLGQGLMIGVAGTSLLPEEKIFLKEVQPCGVIYFRRNIESPSQIRNLSQEISDLLDIPPLIGIDQEGGRVARLKNPFTEYPGNDYLGRYYDRTKKTDLAEHQALAMASELKSVGINYNFTPVADVDSNPKNPIIGSRSFHSDPKIVAKLVKATVDAYRKAKVVSCVKHFPGHGDTFSDSHKELPVVKISKATIAKRELIPFEAAFRAGVPTLMTAHVIYTALDPKNPATLSPIILDSLLRKKMKFKGVVVSDDLEMNAIAAHGAIDEAGLAAIEAGVDLLLVCKSLERSWEVFQLLQKAASRLSFKTRMEEGLRRISALKKTYVKRLKPLKPQKAWVTGWGQHQKLAQRILLNSVSV